MNIHTQNDEIILSVDLDPDIDPDHVLDFTEDVGAKAAALAVFQAPLKAEAVRYGRDSTLTDDPSKPVYEVTHGPLSSEELEYMRDAMFFYNLRLNPKTPHDHPISHMMTEGNERWVLNNRLRDRKFVDVWGSATRNAHLKRSAVVTLEANTVRDCHRMANQMGMANVQQHSWADIRGMVDRDLLFVHSVYYADMAEIARCICDGHGRKAYAIIHRFEKREGSLNRGELSYVCDEEGNVHMRVNASNKRFDHRTTEYFFNQEGVKTKHGSVGWDVHKLAGDSWLVTIFPVPSRVPLPDSIQYSPKVEESFHITSIDEVSVMSFCGVRWLHYTHANTTIELREVGLFDELRKHIAGRERSARFRNDLFSMARRLCNPKDVFSVHGGHHYRVPAEHLSLYVNAAFYVDVQQELSAAVHYQDKIGAEARALSDFYATGSLPTNWEQKAYRTASAICTVADKVIPSTEVGTVVDVAVNLLAKEDPISAIAEFGMDALCDWLDSMQDLATGETTDRSLSEFRERMDQAFLEQAVSGHRERPKLTPSTVERIKAAMDVTPRRQQPTPPASPAPAKPKVRNKGKSRKI